MCIVWCKVIGYQRDYRPCVPSNQSSPIGVLVQPSQCLVLNDQTLPSQRLLVGFTQISAHHGIVECYPETRNSLAALKGLEASCLPGGGQRPYPQSRLIS